MLQETHVKSSAICLLSWAMMWKKSKVQGLPERCCGSCFLHGFRHRWVCMRCSCNVFRTCVVLESNHSFRNSFTGIRTNDMHAQDLIRLLLTEELDKPIRVVYSFGS